MRSKAVPESEAVVREGLKVRFNDISSRPHLIISHLPSASTSCAHLIFSSQAIFSQQSEFLHFHNSRVSLFHSLALSAGFSLQPIMTRGCHGKRSAFLFQAGCWRGAPGQKFRAHWSGRSGSKDAGLRVVFGRLFPSSSSSQTGRCDVTACFAWGVATALSLPFAIE